MSVVEDGLSHMTTVVDDGATMYDSSSTLDDGSCPSSDEYISEEDEGGDDFWERGGIQRNKFARSLSIMRQLPFHDVVIVAGGQRFPAHRVVLAARIPYYRNLFTGPWSDSTSVDAIKEGTTADACDMMLEFAYTGHLRNDMTGTKCWPHLVDALQLADEVGMTSMVRVIIRIAKNVAKSAPLAPSSIKLIICPILPILHLQGKTRSYHTILSKLATSVNAIMRAPAATAELVATISPITLRALLKHAKNTAEVDLLQLIISFACNRAGIPVGRTSTPTHPPFLELIKDEFAEFQLDFKSGEKGHLMMKYGAFGPAFARLLPLVRLHNLTITEFKEYASMLRHFLPAEEASALLTHFQRETIPRLPSNARLRAQFSAILSDPDEISMLIGWIEERFPDRLPEQRLKIRLLYRATDNYFEDFHEHCDGNGPTLVIVRSAKWQRQMSTTDWKRYRHSQHVFGGVNYQPWVTGRIPWMVFLRSAPMNNFLFNIGTGHRFYMRADRMDPVMFSQTGKGPKFGRGDLIIACPPWQAEATEHTFAESAGFTGFPNGAKFAIDEYEVYQIRLVPEMPPGALSTI